MWRDKIVILIAVFILLTGCGSNAAVPSGKAELYEPKTETGTEQETYKTTKVRQEDFMDEVVDGAELYYSSQKAILIDVGNITLDQIKIKEGSKVKKGDVVATYIADQDEADLERQKLELERERKSFNATLGSKQNACSELKRQISKMKSSYEKEIKKIEYKKMQIELEQFKKTEDSLKEKEKEYRKLIADGKKTNLISKVNGIVTSMGNVNEGDAVESGTVLANLRQEKNFVIKADDSRGALRYNMEVIVQLGGDRGDIRYEMKGKVISADNLKESKSQGAAGQESEDNPSDSSGAYIWVSKKDKEKYDFEENNVYVKYAAKKLEKALVVDSKAIYSEIAGEKTKMFVYVVENNNLCKRYISTQFSNSEITVVSQGIEEGQILALEVMDK